jgi:hypothetical protein
MKRKMKSWLFLPYRHQQELPRGPTGQAHHTQGSTKISNNNTLARNLSTGIRLIYIFELPNIFSHQKVRAFNRYNNYYFSLDFKTNIFCIRRKTVPVSQTNRNTYFAREVYILTLKGESVYRTLQNE